MNNVLRPFFFTLIALTFTLFSCDKKDAPSVSDSFPLSGGAGKEVSNDDFNGKTIAVVAGTIFDRLLDKQLKNVTIQYHTDGTGIVGAVLSGKADALLTDEPVARKIVATNPQLAIVTPPLVDDQYGIMVSKGKPLLLKQLDEFYDTIKADGSYGAMVSKWVDSAASPPLPDIPLDGHNGTLNVATDGASDPFSFSDGDGNLTGFAIEYVTRFAAAYGYAVALHQMEFGSLVDSVASGKADIAATSASITPERAKSVDFTKPYYSGGASLAYRKTRVQRPAGFFEKLRSLWRKE
jgi:polar amino acid transport system substrate-binding protein